MGVRDTIAKALADRIRVFHSSPHDIDKFDLSKIGTGQGAQSYGHGLYFAENPKVSGRGGEYWREFLQRFEGTPEGHAANRLSAEKWDRAKALELAQRDLADWKAGRLGDSDYARRMMELRQREVELLASGKPVGPRTYEVDIKARPEEFLQWDKKLSEQPVGEAAWNAAKKQLYGSPEKMTGEEAYRGMAAIDEQGAMNALRDVGIPGVRYLDAQSRIMQPARSYYDAVQRGHVGVAEATGAPDWKRQVAADNLKIAEDRLARENTNLPRTYNYVVNDPNRLEIMAKYGMAGATALPALGELARQDQYGAQQ